MPGSASPPPYRGRFAPSPTGPLHFGSLLTALASFLQARNRGGEWLVRMEDVDRPRSVPGAARDILRTLEHYGLHWDGPVIYQSRRSRAYERALRHLVDRGYAFACGCTRREAASGPPGVDGPIYPGTCRNGLPPGRHARSMRARVGDVSIAFEDAVQGACRQDLASAVGDFVIRRADGLFAYQLAVVVDDAWQGITQIVRGADLLSSTPRQIWLQRVLDLATPGYAHVPVVENGAGQKLSKQTHASAVPFAGKERWLLAALRCLGQCPDDALRDANRDEILAWAVAHWRLEAVPRGPVIVRGADCGRGTLENPHAQDRRDARGIQ